MTNRNLEILSDIFKWQNIEEISEESVQSLSKNVEISLPKDFLMKCTWSYYKKCTIFTVDKDPLLFLKYVREKYVFEVLGIHLTRYFFDAELGFHDYITGLYIKSYKKLRKNIPYIMTTYEPGKHIGSKEYSIEDFYFQLGRQCYLHEILSLYDVYDRHFIVESQDNIRRIDFGRTFENPEKKYLGFQDYLNKKDINFYDKEFQKGYNFEKELVKKNLSGKRQELSKLIRLLRDLQYDGHLVLFKAERFVNRLIDHWSKIGFLQYAGITECQWL